jgi:hypothetical protein
MVLLSRDPKAPHQGSIYPSILSSSSIFLTMPLARRLCLEADLSECLESYLVYRLSVAIKPPFSILCIKRFSLNNIVTTSALRFKSHLTHPFRSLQEGRNVEIYNSFEIDYKIVDGKIQMNMDYLNVKQEQCKKRGHILSYRLFDASCQPE